MILRNLRRDYVEREYRIVIDVCATPMQMRALRDELDSICDEMVPDGDFRVYDSGGKEILYGEE